MSTAQANAGCEILPDLQPEQASDLLMKAAGIPKDTWSVRRHAADRVVKILGFHPLAIIQAGAVIKMPQRTLEEYPDLFDEQGARLLSQHQRKDGSKYRSVYATFEVSAKLLSDSAEMEAADALEILSILGFMHAERVPYSIFEGAFCLAQNEAVRRRDLGDIDDSLFVFSRACLEAVPTCLRRESSAFGNSLSISGAFDRLLSASLVKITEELEDRLISMHPLAHAWSRNRLSPDQQRKAWMATGALLALSLSGNEATRSSFLKLQIHARTLAQHRKGEMTVLPTEEDKVLARLGRLHYENRDEAGAINILQDILSRFVHNQVLSPKNLRHLNRIVARCQSGVGEHTKSIATMKMIVEEDGVDLAMSDPDRLASQHSLAGAYMGNGQHKEAAQLLEHVVETEKTTLDPTHPSRLASQHSLAGAYMGNGQHKEAAQLLEHVVETEKTTLDPTHPSRLASQHSLAGAYMGNGQHKEAAQLLEYVVEIRKAALDPWHLDLCMAQDHLALVRSLLERRQYPQEVEHRGSGTGQDVP